MRLERDRIAQIQTANENLTKEINTLKAECQKLHTQNTEFFKENRDMRDQLKTLNENLRRETEQLLVRDRENQLLRDDNE